MIVFILHIVTVGFDKSMVTLTSNSTQVIFILINHVFIKKVEKIKENISNIVEVFNSKILHFIDIIEVVFKVVNGKNENRIVVEIFKVDSNIAGSVRTSICIESIVSVLVDYVLDFDNDSFFVTVIYVFNFNFINHILNFLNI